MKPLDSLGGQRGSASIEATISLTIFAFVIVAVYMLVSFCLVQARVAYAIDTTAKEMSQYSYLYHAAGLDSKYNQLNEQGQQAADTYNQLVTVLSGVANEAEEASSDLSAYTASLFTDEKGEVITDLESQGEALAASLSAASSDPKGFVRSIAALAGVELWNEASYLFGSTLAKSLTRRHFGDTAEAADAYLKGKGLENGYDDLDFSTSRLFAEGSDQIEVNVCYTMHLPKILNLDKQVTICQSAVTKGWFGDVEG